MLKKLVVIGALVLLCSMWAAAQDQEPSKVDIFGGYQYLHANSGVSGVGRAEF
jgi:hypothetical protein